jgi:hypothetical protein
MAVSAVTQGCGRAARWRLRAVALGVLGILLVPAFGVAQSTDDSEHDAIKYSTSTPQDAVAKLQAQLDKGQVALKRDPVRGYLASVLHALKVPVSSQMLVFSKTSLQRHKISPQTPRAIYFNDTTYVGFVPGGNVLEISAQDPQLGPVFYTVDQEAPGKPKFVRQTHECLSCHASTATPPPSPAACLGTSCAPSSPTRRAFRSSRRGRSSPRTRAP